MLLLFLFCSRQLHLDTGFDNGRLLNVSDLNVLINMSRIHTDLAVLNRKLVRGC